jgi:hypothetical protein
MTLKIDPTKITSKFGIASVIVIAFESLFFLWFQSATESLERVTAGGLAAIVLVIFLFRVFAKDEPMLDPGAKKIVGKWKFISTSSKGNEGHGMLTISNVDNNLCISGVLYEGDKQTGTFNSEVTRVNQNRLIFYYVLRDQNKMENMDAVSIVVFDPEEPKELNGDWIVASKTPHHGSIRYTRA